MTQKRFDLISPINDNEIYIMDRHDDDKVVLSEVVEDSEAYKAFCKIQISLNKDFEIYTQLIYTYCGY